MNNIIWHTPTKQVSQKLLCTQPVHPTRSSRQSRVVVAAASLLAERMICNMPIHAVISCSTSRRLISFSLKCSPSFLIK